MSLLITFRLQGGRVKTSLEYSVNALQLPHHGDKFFHHD